MSIKQGIREFVIAGKLSEGKGMLISATDNYFKALIHAVDYFLQEKIGKIPDSHNERFRILERENKELYDLIDYLFKFYVKSYRDIITKGEFLEVKNGLKRVLKITGLEKEFIKYL